jgi:hypothetical protein
MKLSLLQRPGRVPVADFNSSLRDVLSALESKLSATTRISGFSQGGWAQVDVSGDDHEILEELISRNLGRTVSSFDLINLNDTYAGLIHGRLGGRLEVEVGIEDPRPVSVKIDLNTLRAQLCDGKLRTINEITEAYCLQPESKITIRTTRLEPDSGMIEGWMADSQIDLFANLISSNLERLQAFHCTRTQVEAAVKRMNLERDVVSVESMTLTTHSVVCKLGTNAVGLIPKLGSVLRKSELMPFIPTRITSRCRKW